MCADTKLAAKMLGFKPRVTLDEGLKLTLKEDERFQRVKV
jgi:nucleoside-diphosphate-sugar epimerase